VIWDAAHKLTKRGGGEKERRKEEGGSNNGETSGWRIKSAELRAMIRALKDAPKAKRVRFEMKQY
jgi:hypothetical protein